MPCGVLLDGQGTIQRQAVPVVRTRRCLLTGTGTCALRVSALALVCVTHVCACACAYVCMCACSSHPCVPLVQVGVPVHSAVPSRRTWGPTNLLPPPQAALPRGTALAAGEHAGRGGARVSASAEGESSYSPPTPDIVVPSLCYPNSGTNGPSHWSGQEVCCRLCRLALHCPPFLLTPARKASF